MHVYIHLYCIHVYIFYAYISRSLAHNRASSYKQMTGMHIYFLPTLSKHLSSTSSAVSEGIKAMFLPVWKEGNRRRIAGRTYILTSMKRHTRTQHRTTQTDNNSDQKDKSQQAQVQ